MSSGEIRRVSRQDIQLVQNLIERCLQLYMNQKEVVNTLLVEAKIEPDFTELVWQKLEEENRDFFKAYHVRLMVKHQIMIFNELLKQQVELMQKMCPSGFSAPISNGNHNSQYDQNLSGYGVEQAVVSSRSHNIPQPNSLIVTSAQQNMQISESDSSHSGKMNISTTIQAAQNSQVEFQNRNGMNVKSEPGFSNSSTFPFGEENNVLDVRPRMRDGSVGSFGTAETNSHSINDHMLDVDASSFGFLGQIPRNFSLSDLTADFTQSADILENYSRSPFLSTNSDGFLDSPGGECQGENTRLETISEGVSYDDFGSDLSDTPIG